MQSFPVHLPVLNMAISCRTVTCRPFAGIGTWLIKEVGGCGHLELKGRSGTAGSGSGIQFG